jgi:hypothetical protein
MPEQAQPADEDSHGDPLAEAKMVLQIKYTEDWKDTIDGKIDAFADENGIEIAEWNMKLVDAKNSLVLGSDLSPKDFPLRLEYTRKSKAERGEQEAAREELRREALPARPSWISRWMYNLIRCIFFVTALMFWLGFLFQEEEDFDEKLKPLEEKIVFPRFSWLLPAGYVSQTRHHWDSGFSKTCFARQQLAFLVLVLMLLRFKTLPALVSIANIGGFGICFHNYQLKSSTEDRWPMLAASALAVYLVMFDNQDRPERILKTNWKLGFIIFMYVLGFAACYFILGTEPVPMRMTTTTTTTTKPASIRVFKAEEF